MRIARDLPSDFLIFNTSNHWQYIYIVHIFDIAATSNHFSICFCYRVFEPNQRKKKNIRKKRKKAEMKRIRGGVFLHSSLHMRLTEYKMKNRKRNEAEEERRQKKTRNEDRSRSDGGSISATARKNKTAGRIETTASRLESIICLF